MTNRLVCLLAAMSFRRVAVPAFACFLLHGMLNDSVVLGQDCGAVSFTETTYSLASEQPGYFPRSIAVGDVGEDQSGDLDFAVSRGQYNNKVRVYVNDGTGDFPDFGQFAMGDDARPWPVALSDLDHDGDLDLLCANNNIAGDTLTTRLNDGSGDFVSKTEFSDIGGYVHSMAMGDLNGDDYPDAVVVAGDDDAVYVLLNEGVSGGTWLGFETPVSYSVGDDPTSVVIANVEASSEDDVLTVNHGDNDFTLLINDGTGEFPTGSRIDFPIVIATEPWDLNVGDLDNNGLLDVAICAGPDTEGDSTIVVFYNTGQSGGDRFDLLLWRYLPQDAQPRSVAWGDINGDLALDVVVANLGIDSVSVLFAISGGSWFSNDTCEYDTGDGPVSVALGDFDGNEMLDIVTANTNSSNVSVLLQDE